MTMIDHTGVHASDLTRSKAFYRAALAPLGYAVIMEFEDAVGFGVPPKPDFWMAQGNARIAPIHVAFRADSRAQVDGLYKAAIAAGGRDNGPPGLRPHYHQNYYGAFVLDPDGNNIEAVCHTAE
jgi:catechol 2,3-dioxygenase-like lactoylglutathione lyase family enzyme